MLKDSRNKGKNYTSMKEGRLLFLKMDGVSKKPYALFIKHKLKTNK